MKFVAMFFSMFLFLSFMSSCQTMNSLYADYKASESSPKFYFYGPPANDLDSLALFPVKKGFGVTGDVEKIKACVGYKDVKRIVELIKRERKQENSGK